MGFVLAQQPTPPSIPTVPAAPEAPVAPTAPSAPTAPTIEPTETPRQENPSNNEEATPTPTRRHQQEEQVTPTGTVQENTAPTTTATPTPSPSSQQDGNQQVGDTAIITGDADSTTMLTTTANGNGASVAQGNGDSASVANAGNGVNSTNDGSIKVADNSNTIQNNAANVANNLDQSTNTGVNSTSGNVGESYIRTGDANTAATVMTAVNTNIDGVMVSQFDVNDNQTEDLVLDFAAHCISGCTPTNASVNNTANGAGSTNSGTFESQANNASFQNNDATVGNNLVLNANSGKNTSDYNTGGTSGIVTGDANVSANALTFANNNFGGNVVYGVVNIYGDLHGDIVFPEEVAGTCCVAGDLLAANTANGANSNNLTNGTFDTTNTNFQTNTAQIDNNVILNAQTGDNTTSANTGGDTLVKTGQANTDVNVVNVANNNIDGGNWWLVLVNEAGNWVGHIIGGNQGSNTMAASQGTAFSVNPNGDITVTNGGNGTGTNNNSTTTQEVNNTTVQNNTAKINNTLDLSANTGGNTASYNTNGDNFIQTGDANIIANLVNFVNNNVTGGGKLFVTVVNVFGNWAGNFVTPDGQKELALNPTPTPTALQNLAIGGTNVTTEGYASTPTPTIAAVNTTQQTVVVQVTPTPTVSTAKKHITQSPTFENGNTLGVTQTHSEGDEDTLAFAASTNALSDAIVTPTPAVKGKKVVSINIAWLLILIPCVILLASLAKVAKKLTLRSVYPSAT